LNSNINATKPLPHLEIKSIQFDAIDGRKLNGASLTHYEKNQRKEFLSPFVIN
jgi:hypothetical protein